MIFMIFMIFIIRVSVLCIKMCVCCRSAVTDLRPEHVSGVSSAHTEFIVLDRFSSVTLHVLIHKAI